MGRVCMLGLDGLSPDLLFVDYWPQLPNFQRLARRGMHARLRSCEPPITVPAWACMVTGREPGALGCYGFHDRASRNYDDRRLASSLSYLQPPLWERLSQAGLRCRILGVPQTYPAKPLVGTLICGPPAPEQPDGYTSFPAGAERALQTGAGPYACDVPAFRALRPAQLVADVAQLTHNTFGVVDSWLGRDDWDFLMACDIGADRLQHGLWAACRPEHPRFVAGHPQAHALRDYYQALDAYLGRVMAKLRADDLLIVVSDHGAQAMHGGFAINDWLIEMGYLQLHQESRLSSGPHKLLAAAVDWRRTRAWADGGYVGRIYLNVEGREPLGIVPPGDVDGLCARMGQQIAALPAQAQRSHAALRPRDVYGEVHGIAPDLMVYMADLRLRCLGTLGHVGLWPQANDAGFDAANHAHDGIVVMGPKVPQAACGQASLYDIAPTVLAYFGLGVPEVMHGRVLGL